MDENRDVASFKDVAAFNVIIVPFVACAIPLIRSFRGQAGDVLGGMVAMGVLAVVSLVALLPPAALVYRYAKCMPGRVRVTLISSLGSWLVMELGCIVYMSLWVYGLGGKRETSVIVYSVSAVFFFVVAIYAVSALIYWLAVKYLRKNGFLC